MELIAGSHRMPKEKRPELEGSSPHEASLQDALPGVARPGTTCRAIISRPLGMKSQDGWT